jgi:hypothetical protein
MPPTNGAQQGLRGSLELDSMVKTVMQPLPSVAGVENSSGHAQLLNLSTFTCTAHVMLTLGRDGPIYITCSCFNCFTYTSRSTLIALHLLPH